MKIRNLLIAIFLVCTSFSIQNKQCKLTIQYSFKNIQTGYDHTTRLRVYLDEALVAETEPHLQSKKQTIRVNVPQGKHKIRLINMTKYNGEWEERSIANGYSTNGEFSSQLMLSKKKKITVLYDINEKDPIVTVK